MTLKASSASITVRIPNIDDLDAILSLLSKVFHKEFNREYISNKYFNNPMGACPVALVLAGGECVAFSGLLPVWFYHKDQKMKAALEADLAIIEAYRNIEVLLKLISLLKEQVIKEHILFSYSITNSNTASVMRVIWGKTFVAPVPALVKVLTYETGLKDTIPAAPILRTCLKSLSLINKMFFLLRTKPLLPMDIHQPDQLGHPFDIFSESLSVSDHRIRFSKDGAYLFWRYGQLPSGNSVRILTARSESGSLCAMAIVNVVEAKRLKRGRIYELCLQDVMPECKKRSFVKGVVRWFYSQNCDRIDCWNFSSDPLYPLLRKAGLVPRPKQDLQISYMMHDTRANGSLNAILRKSENWSFALGDTDMI